MCFLHEKRVMKPVLVFDIETIPDVPGLRRINDLPGELSDDEVARLGVRRRRRACRWRHGVAIARS